MDIAGNVDTCQIPWLELQKERFFMGSTFVVWGSTKCRRLNGVIWAEQNSGETNN